MSQTLSSLYIHIIFSTKERIPFLDQSIRFRLWQYIAGICKNENSPALQIGGTADHIHVLCNLSRTISLQTLVTKIKSESSKWIKQISPDYNDFHWQSGYGAFSVNPGEIEKVTEYIRNQEQHHCQRDFYNELRLFLQKYNINYDEKYLWN